jgi:hypothetical protein
MTRLEKCETLKNKGYTYEPETGKIFGVYGNQINRKNNRGYIIIRENGLYGHHFAWYWVYGNVDFKMLDHKNRIKNDNRISNLIISNHSQNALNKETKGYTWDKSRNKWKSQIHINGKTKYLGNFDTEEKARNTYLNAKQKYYITD